MGASRNSRPIPNWQDHILFHEYFHGDNGAGLGASHQTGWTGLIARLISIYGDPNAQESILHPRGETAKAPAREKVKEKAATSTPRRKVQAS